MGHENEKAREREEGRQQAEEREKGRGRQGAGGWVGTPSRGWGCPYSCCAGAGTPGRGPWGSASGGRLRDWAVSVAGAAHLEAERVVGTPGPPPLPGALLA